MEVTRHDVLVEETKAVVLGSSETQFQTLPPPRTEVTNASLLESVPRPQTSLTHLRRSVSVLWGSLEEEMTVHPRH
jgi:hypothetical protein